MSEIAFSTDIKAKCNFANNTMYAKCKSNLPSSRIRFLKNNMKNMSCVLKKETILIILCVLALDYSIFACSCSKYAGFLSGTKYSEFVIKGKVIGFEYSYFENDSLVKSTNSEEATGKRYLVEMTVEIIDVLKGVVSLKILKL